MMGLFVITWISLVVLLHNVDGYYHETSFSTRDISRCKTIYMCPTFCYKLVKGCFVCRCDESTTEFMVGAMDRMKDDYKPIKQTGSTYQVKQTGSTYQLEQTGIGGMTGSGIFPGMGSLSGVYSFGGAKTTPTNLRQSGSTNNIKMPHYHVPEQSSFFQPSPHQMLPGQCPLMDYSCPSVCWVTDSSTGCIGCGCKIESSTYAPKLQSVTAETTTIKTTTENHLPTVIKTIKPEAIGSSNIKTIQTIKSVCSPIMDSCPLTCLSYDHITFCATCDCPSTTSRPVTKATTASQVVTTTNHPKQTILLTEQPISTSSEGTTTDRTTTTATTPTTVQVNTTEITPTTTIVSCKPINQSCPTVCKTYDRTTFCPVCKCTETVIPSVAECNSLKTNCPTDCVKLGDNGCPICACSLSGLPESSNTDGGICAPIRKDCQTECITYDPQSYCPLCQCFNKQT